MSEQEREQRDFPKNIRQIGEAGKEKRIYLEDYAAAFLRQVQAAVLLGETVSIRGVPCFFVCGAVEVPEGNFSEENWDTVAEEAKKTFGELLAVGWFIRAEEIPEELSAEDREIYQAHFHGREAVLVVYNELEEEEAVYLVMDGKLQRQNGFFIYYEKNARMQDSLVAKNEGHSVEKETEISDEAIRSFRKIIEEKKREKESEQPETKKRREKNPPASSMLRFLYSASTFLVLVILVLGITMINNYDRVRQMEETVTRMTEAAEAAGRAVEVDETEAMEEQIELEGVLRTEGETSGSRTTLVDLRTGETELLPGILFESEGESTEESQAAGMPSETSAPETSAPETDSALTGAPAHASQATYTVKLGDTLADICARYYGSADRLGEICDLNGIANPNAITPGQKLVLP